MEGQPDECVLEREREKGKGVKRGGPALPPPQHQWINTRGKRTVGSLGEAQTETEHCCHRAEKGDRR